MAKEQALNHKTFDFTCLKFQIPSEDTQQAEMLPSKAQTQRAQSNRCGRSRGVSKHYKNCKFDCKYSL